MVILKRLATAINIIGAVLIAANLGINREAFMILSVANIKFIIVFWKTEKEIIVLNSAFLAINLLGIARTL